MAAQLYPPKIPSILPAFYGNTLIITYTPNISVGSEDYTGMVLQIKDFISSSAIATISTEQITTSTVTFDISEINHLLTVGQFYRVQIAYCQGENIGIFSSVSTIKRTAQPSIEIDTLSTNSTNYLTLGAVFKGKYELSDEDPAETIKSYTFTIYDENNQVFETSGEKIYNANKDMEYKMNKLLDITKLYYVQFQITTINNLVSLSVKYIIASTPSVGTSLNANLIAQIDNDNACVTIGLEGSDFQAGTYLISRTSEKENWNVVYPMAKVTITKHSNGKILFTDFTLEHGVKYRYGIQLYNKHNVYSERKETQEIVCNFEDVFLYDGEKQLKIRFNPQISSFKSTIQEQKIDTLGSAYPFFFKNGTLNYKEFPINGLISYNMDEQGYFLSPIENNGESCIDLSNYNMRKEREFKLAVMNWLNDGKIKLFKSAAEGNYLVRLMNTSLSPENGLGRMIHSFSSTAYECKENNYENLVALGLIKINEHLLKNVVIEQVKLEANQEKSFIDQEINYIKITDCLPGATFTFTFATQEELSIIIGATGSYCLDNPYSPIIKIKCNAPCDVEYRSYSLVFQSEFDKIKSISFKDIIGEVTQVSDTFDTFVLNPWSDYNPEEMSNDNKFYYKNYLLEIQKLNENEDLIFELLYKDNSEVEILLPYDRVRYQIRGDDLNNIAEIKKVNEDFNIIWSYLQITVQKEEGE